MESVFLKIFFLEVFSFSTFKNYWIICQETFENQLEKNSSWNIINCYTFYSNNAALSFLKRLSFVQKNTKFQCFQKFHFFQPQSTDHLLQNGEKNCSSESVRLGQISNIVNCYLTGKQNWISWLLVDVFPSKSRTRGGDY